MQQHLLAMFIISIVGLVLGAPALETETTTEIVSIPKEVDQALDPGKATFGALLLPQDILPLTSIRVKKEAELIESEKNADTESLDVAESHIFQPKFTYKAVQARRRRIRLLNGINSNI